MPKVKKVPQRQCVGCREMKDKKSLLRVVKSPEGQVSLDFGGKKPGRGAYVCRDVACLQRARKTRALERAFETAVPAEVYGQLDLVAVTSVERSELLYKKQQFFQFFQNEGVRIILAVVLFLTAIVILKLTVFRRKRRPKAGSAARRGNYKGTRM